MKELNIKIRAESDEGLADGLYVFADMVAAGVAEGEFDFSGWKGEFSVEVVCREGLQHNMLPINTAEDGTVFHRCTHCGFEAEG